MKTCERCGVQLAWEMGPRYCHQCAIAIGKPAPTFAPHCSRCAVLEADLAALRQRCEQAEAKAEQYQIDWMAAKAEFGDTLAALRQQRCATCRYASHGDIDLWCEKWSPAIPSSRDVMCADIKGCGGDALEGGSTLDEALALYAKPQTTQAELALMVLAGHVLAREFAPCASATRRRSDADMYWRCD